MAANSILRLDYPLFTNFELFFLCKYKNLKSSTTGQSCGACFKDFISMIRHQKEVHGIILRSKIDYCIECQVVFYTKLVAIQHYIGHCLAFQHDRLLLEDDDTLNHEKPIFDKLKILRQDIINTQLAALIPNEDEMNE